MNEQLGTPEALLLTEAIEQVESRSIRDWATSAHNAPIFLAIARKSLKQGKTPPHMLCSSIVCCAMG